MFVVWRGLYHHTSRHNTLHRILIGQLIEFKMNDIELVSFEYDQTIEKYDRRTFTHFSDRKVFLRIPSSHVWSKLFYSEIIGN